MVGRGELDADRDFFVGTPLFNVNWLEVEGSED